MKLKDLQERRAILVGEMRQITEKPAGTGGDLSTEQTQRFDTLKAELQTVEKSIERQAFIDEADRRTQGTQIHTSGDERFDAACRDFSLRAAIAGAAGLGVEWGREREIGAELVKRAGRPFKGIAVPMSVFHKPIEKRVVTGAGEGSNLIATDLRGDQFIDVLRAKMVVRRLGARVLSGLVGDVDLPKLASSASVAWVADNAALTPGDPDFAKVEMSPKHAGVVTEFSRSTLLQSSPDIEQLLRSDFAQLLAQALDQVALKGGGSNEPTGVMQTNGLATVNFAGGPTWAKVLSMIEAVEEANAEASAWVTTPACVRVMRSTVRVGSTDSRMIMEAPNELAGYPLASTQNAPRTMGSPATDDALIFGMWSDVLIGFWSELDVLVNPFESTAFLKGNVQIRAMMTADVAIRHIESFCASSNFEPG